MSDFFNLSGITDDDGKLLGGELSNDSIELLQEQAPPTTTAQPPEGDNDLERQLNDFQEQEESFEMNELEPLLDLDEFKPPEVENELGLHFNPPPLKVTKEDLQFTPVPLFECIYCVRGKLEQALEKTGSDVISKIGKNMTKRLAE